MMQETFAERLKKAMYIKGIKPAVLSKKTGIKPPLISNYLSGRYKAKQDRVYIIAKALDVSEAWLMGLDVPMERKNSNNKINDELQEKIESLNNDQKKAIINIIDNMK